MEHVPCRPAPYGGPKIERLIDNLSRCTRVHSDARPAEALVYCRNQGCPEKAIVYFAVRRRCTCSSDVA